MKNSLDSLVGLSNPNRGFFVNFSDAIYNYNIGDEWCYSRYSSSSPKEYTCMKITGKTVYTDSVVYTYQKKTKWDDFDTSWYTFEQYKLNVIISNNYETPFWGVQIGSIDNIWPFVKEIRAYRTGSDSCVNIESSMGGYYYTFVFGVDNSYSYSSMGGVQWNNKSITYIKKGNRSWGTPFDFGTLSAQQIMNDNHLSVYPNPVKDILHFYKKDTYEIVDISGKVQLRAFDALQLDVSSLPAGIYFVKDSFGGRAKLIKE